jgi:hypothetical protein
MSLQQFWVQSQRPPTWRNMKSDNEEAVLMEVHKKAEPSLQ